jgi:hypothetical protein
MELNITEELSIIVPVKGIAAVANLHEEASKVPQSLEIPIWKVARL